MTDQAPLREITVVPFRDELASAFDLLNRLWLEGFGLLEDSDLPYLLDPRGTILDKGGAVFFALDDGQPVGTVAAIPLTPDVFELAKLAVSPSARGRGIGRRLTLVAIEFAASAGARSVVLSSNHQLREAIRLYESLGFVHSTGPVAGVPYTTADVFMELRLDG